jgi:hypothetical protein
VFEGAVKNIKILALAVLFYLLMTLQAHSSEQYYPEIVLIFVAGIAFLLFTSGNKPGGGIPIPGGISK